jgi:hypothetical protein
MNNLWLLFLDQLKLLNKIWRTRYANLMTMNFRLRIFQVLKTTADSILWPLFDLFSRWIMVCSKNQVCCTQNKEQLLLKYQGLDQLGLQDIKLQSRVPEVKPQLWQPNSLAPKQHCIESCEFHLTRLETKIALYHLIKFVLHKMNYNFC